MNPLRVALACSVVVAVAFALSACGGGGDGGAVEDENVLSPVELLAPPAPDDASVPSRGVPSPAGDAAPSSPVVNERPCRAPQASEQGRAHGKPPVERCA